MLALLSAAAQAGFVLLGASAAVAQPGLAVPAQVFVDGRASSTPVARPQPHASRWDRARSAGPPCVHMTRTVGTDAPTPMKVCFHFAGRATDVVSAAADQDDEFVANALSALGERPSRDSEFGP